MPNQIIYILKNIYLHLKENIKETKTISFKNLRTSQPF